MQCRQTNSEGEFVKWCHDALDNTDGMVVNPGAWTHYAWSIHDALEPLEIPVVEVHLSNVDEREEWRRALRHRGPRRRPLRRQGPGRLPRGPRIPEGERVNDRIARLRERIERAAARHEPDERRLPRRLRRARTPRSLVERDRVRLFTDFRYIEAARAVEGVELVQTRRDVIGELAETLTGRIGFEAATLTYARYEVLRKGGIEPVPTYGVVEALRAVKDEQRARDAPPRLRDHGPRLRAPDRGAVRRPHRARRRVGPRRSSSTRKAGSGLAFESIVGAGPTGARPHARAGDRTIEAGELVVIDAGTTIDGYASDYTRTFATGPLDDEAKEAYETVLLRTAGRARRHPRRVSPASTRTLSRAA